MIDYGFDDLGSLFILQERYTGNLEDYVNEHHKNNYREELILFLLEVLWKILMPLK